MSSYSVTFARSARKELQALDPPIGQRILARIEALSASPRPRGCKKLRGSTDLWRIRVGSYRVIYRIDDAQEVVDVSVVRHRRDVYR